MVSFSKNMFNFGDAKIVCGNKGAGVGVISGLEHGDGGHGKFVSLRGIGDNF